MRIFNLRGDEWDRTEDRKGWRSRDAWVGQRVGAELIGGSVYELDVGDRLWPYHTHHANEEWLIVVHGKPTLRTPQGEQTLREGDVVCFPRGKEGAHQVINRTDTAIRVLILSTLIAPDIVEYLDSGKIGARSIRGERIMLSRLGPIPRLLGGRRPGAHAGVTAPKEPRCRPLRAPDSRPVPGPMQKSAPGTPDPRVYR